MEYFWKDKASLSSKCIWVVNPFDPLPNETDVQLRYWAMCRTFAEQGHTVIWWSSNFFHLHKTKREPCPDTDGFSVRLIETPPYSKNISFARLKNHKAFADGFYREAMVGLNNGELKVPDRIVTSLPPLGIAQSAFRIRDHVRKKRKVKQTAENANTALPCEVIVDIMDAWPEAFYQILPKRLRDFLGTILFFTMHRSAKHAYNGADKISGVGQSYLNLAQRYLQSGSDNPDALNHTEKMTGEPPLKTPLHLCYHGTDLTRFDRDLSGDMGTYPGVLTPLEKRTRKPTHIIQHTLNTPLRAVYLGAMGSGYDLQTIIDIAERWKEENIFPFQINFAGAGSQLEKLKVRCYDLGLSTRKGQHSGVSIDEACGDGVANTPDIPTARVVFHGYLRKEAINELLLSSKLALVPNRPDSLVACPYKVGEYAAAGLPILSCLKGELGELLNHWNAGSLYNEGDPASLHAAFRSYSTDSNLLRQQGLNARRMAEELFDREKSYQALSDFILSSSP